MFKGFFYFLAECWKVNWKFPVLIFFEKLLEGIQIIFFAVIPKFIIDAIFVEQNHDKGLFYIIAFVVGLFSISFLIRVLGSIDYVEMNKTVNKYDAKFVNRFLHAQYQTIETPDFLDKTMRARQYVNGMQGGFGEVLRQGMGIFVRGLTLVSLAAIIFTLSPIIILGLSAVVVIQGVLMSRFTAPIRQYRLEMAVVQRRKSYFEEKAQDFQYGKDLRNYDTGDWFQSKFLEQQNKVVQFFKKLARLNFLVGLSDGFCLAAQYAMAYFFLFYQAFSGKIGVGDFTMYVTAITSFFSGLTMIIAEIVQIRHFKIFYQAYKEYIDTPIEQLSNDNKPALPERFEVEFDNVSFKYGSAENFALENVSVKFNNKERIAIIGENGAGKSTFVKLLMRLYKPTSGRILLNGVDINEIDYEYYQTLFATVFQDFKLFSFSIRDNITFGSEQTKESEARLEKILRTTGVAEMVEGLEHGLDTNMYRDFDDAGFTPSGGQGQKIAIARAAYKDSPIVILDEPTAALDPRAENQIYEQFDEFFKDRCSLYISHRMAVTKFSDRTLVFDGGRIVQDGTHASLITVDGKYKELYDLQAQYYTE